MKNVLISISAFIIMLLLMCLSMSYLNRASLKLEAKSAEIQEAIQGENWEKAYTASMDFKDIWNNYTPIIKVFVNHQEIDNVEIELQKLPSFVKEHTKDEAFASAQTLDFLIKHLSNLEKVNVQNIF